MKLSRQKLVNRKMRVARLKFHTTKASTFTKVLLKAKIETTLINHKENCKAIGKTTYSD